MNIMVYEADGKNIHLPLPTGFLLNGLSANLLSALLKEKNLKISGKQLGILFQAIKLYKKDHPEWKLVEVYDCDGNTVEITI